MDPQHRQLQMGAAEAANQWKNIFPLHFTVEIGTNRKSQSTLLLNGRVVMSRPASRMRRLMVRSQGSL